MKRKGAVNVLMSVLLSVSMLCTPCAKLSGFAAEETEDRAAAIENTESLEAESNETNEAETVDADLSYQNEAADTDEPDQTDEVRNDEPSELEKVLDDETSSEDDAEPEMIYEDQSSASDNDQQDDKQSGVSDQEENLDDHVALETPATEEGKSKKYGTVSFGQESYASASTNAEPVAISVDITYDQSSARTMLDEVNEFRTGTDAWVWDENNSEKVYISSLDSLSYNGYLEDVAMKRAAEIALSYSHTRPNGSTVADLLEDEGFDTDLGYAENISVGHTSTHDAFLGWLEEDENYEGQGHRRNMLRSEMGSVGIAHAIYGGYDFWVQVFSYKESGWEGDSPFDGERTCEIQVDPSKASISFEAEPSSLRIINSTYEAVPELSFYIQMPDCFQNEKCRICPDYTVDSASPDLFSVSYGYGEGSIWPDYEQVGTGSLLITAMGTEFTIPVQTCWPLSDEGEITLKDVYFDFDGDEKRAGLSVFFQNNELEEGKDYTVSYENNINPGTATATVTGMGDYLGELRADYTIGEGTPMLASGTCGEGLFWKIDEEGAMTIWGSGEMEVPEDVDYHEYTAYPWMDYHDDIVRLYVKSGVHNLGYRSFLNCDSLREVVIEPGMDNVGMEAFDWCDSLETVELPDDLNYINVGAFRNCVNLRSIHLPSGLEEIENETFHGCEKLSEVTLPEGLQYFGIEAFAGCSSLKKMNIPDSALEIGSRAFKDCSGLEEISLPEGLEIISYEMLKGCTNLKEITIPCTVVTIEGGAFKGCESLREIVVPSSVQIVGDYPSDMISFGGALPGVFEGCSSLEMIELPEEIREINNYTFESCINLKEVRIPASVSRIGVSAFNNCSELKRVNFEEGSTLETIDHGAFQFCKKLNSIEFPSSLKVIGVNTFDECVSLKNVVITENVKEIGEQAFISCTGLTALTFLPEDEVSIGAEAFSDCSSLISAVLSSGCITIPECCFLGCEKLQNVVVKDGVTSIGESAFYSTDLSNLTLPVSLTKIDASAIDTMPTLDIKKRDIYYEGTYEQWKKIENVKGLQDWYFIHCQDQTIAAKKCILVSKIVLNSTSLTLEKGGSVLLSEKSITPGNAANKALKWISSNSKVATVASDGTIKAVGTGTAVITAAAKDGSGVKATCKVTVTLPSVAKATVTGIKAKVWTGKALTQAITVKKGKTVLKKNTDYTVTYTNNKNVGTATLTITGKGNYTGKLKKTFIIKPKGTSLVKLTGGTNALTVSWKKQASQTTGYQIQYSQKKTFTSSKTITVAKAATTSRKVTGLASKRLYYVRIRTYKTVGGKKYYSAWSAVKSVRTR